MSLGTSQLVESSAPTNARTKSVWCHSSNFPERTGEMALIRKACRKTYIRQGPLWIQQQTASRARPQSMHVFPDSFALESAKHPRQMHRMHSRFSAQFLQREPLTVLRLQLIQQTRKPGLRSTPLSGWPARG